MSKGKMKDLTPRYHILVIGSGGTGTYFLKEFSRYLATASDDVLDSIGTLCIADGDSVEEKNLNRQCFSTDDIGANKAVAFTEALNDMISDISTFEFFPWKPYGQYITTLSQLDELLQCENNPHIPTNYIEIPLIIGAVDNDACRMLCEQWFEKSDNCIYFDSGNDFSSGECVYAYKIKGKVLSPTKSYYFPCMREGDLRPVTELSCEELNKVAPQHILTNMVASTMLLSGIMQLLNPDIKSFLDRMKLGYVMFDSFSTLMDFTPYEKIKASREAVL